MAKSYKEQDFEEHIEEHLLASGYIKQPPEAYDKALCLIPNQVMEFVQQSQPKEYEKLQKQYGPDTPQKLCYRLSEEIRKKGALQVLRQGIKDRGAKFRLAYFKPASGLNPEHQTLYGQNRLAVVRQLKYSQKNENAIDLGFFLNGLPIITAELKNSLTGQFVENAIKQYRKDRQPKGEPLLQFKRCLVHFAVGNETVFMTTRLQGDRTRFLPFNLDTENPVNPNGHKSAYLWEDIWQPDTLLDLIQNYLHLQTNKAKVYDKKEGLVERTWDVFIFPRFHQLDVVRKLLAAVRLEGAGHDYLIQHSAGSGKSNSIAWLAHQLASLYQRPTDKDRLFDSIIVVTDRRVLDKQLQDTIKQFEQTTGVVMPIDQTSAQLKAALESGKDIIITTLQKFPMIADEMTSLKGRRFAVIIDEAHSSQSGESAKHLKKALSVNQLAEAEREDTDDFDLEDEIVKEIRTRGHQKHISYFAFTATPKNKTLELFGRKTVEGNYVAFHIYSMRQAIEEEFILDVLENYTTFKRYFKLVKTIETDDEYEKRKAIRLLTNYVDLQPHAIEMKSRIMLDHFLGATVNAIQGRGRAMVVTRSRLHALKYYLMFKRIMTDRKLTFKPMVAFSGTVRDPDTGLDYTETSANGLAPRVSIPDAFKTPEYRILIVANKFQTGFDEPLLHTMYVDKKLGGVNAVQTLSRLNRTMRGKSETIVLDFVNDAEEIQNAFQPYYQTTRLEEETDPNKLYDLSDKLEEFEVYTQADVEDFAKVFFDPAIEGEKLQPVLDRVFIQWNYKQKDEREDFRSLLQSFIRLYGFVSQLITFEDSDLEKLYVFAKNLNRKLPKQKDRLPYHIRDAVSLDSFRIQQTYSGSLALDKKDIEIAGISTGTPTFDEDERDTLTKIVRTLNEVYATDFSDEDKVDMEKIGFKLDEHEELRAVLNSSNSKENIRYKFDQVVDQLFLEFVHTKLDLYKKLTDPKVNTVLKEKWFDRYYRQYRGV